MRLLVRLGGVVLGVRLIALPARSAEPDIAVRCAAVRNDDTILPYAPPLRTGLLAAYTRLFPHGPAPDEAQLKAGAHIRCMDGHLMACFTGANLPCDKLDSARASQSAKAFCRDQPNLDIVPAYAVGHDAAYTYRCVGGVPAISGTTFPLDARGFAAPLWAPME